MENVEMLLDILKDYELAKKTSNPCKKIDINEKCLKCSLKQIAICELRLFAVSQYRKVVLAEYKKLADK